MSRKLNHPAVKEIPNIDSEQSTSMYIKMGVQSLENTIEYIDKELIPFKSRNIFGKVLLAANECIINSLRNSITKKRPESFQNTIKDRI